MRDSTTVATDLSFMLGHLYTIGIVASIEQLALSTAVCLWICLAYGVYTVIQSVKQKIS